MRQVTAGASNPVPAPSATYDGISYILPQLFNNVPKYGGGLATYTEMHRPIAVFDSRANKTFFVYGADDSGFLGIYMGCFDHESGEVCRPRRVTRKTWVDDPHDNAALLQDPDGYLWVMVSGRANLRPGEVWRSDSPNAIDLGFSRMNIYPFTYPQTWWTPSNGKILVYTRYGVANDHRLIHITLRPEEAGVGRQMIAGSHYAVTHAVGDHVVLAYSDNPRGDIDRRANVSVIQSMDGGRTWYSVDGRKVWDFGVAGLIPDGDRRTRVVDTMSHNTLVYLKDVRIDPEGSPVVLFVTSPSADPNDVRRPRCLQLARFDRQRREWRIEELSCAVLHNYSTGFLSDDTRTVVFPLGMTTLGIANGAGGELWRGTNGATGWSWEQLTFGSCKNNNYVRDVHGGSPGEFEFLWADGHPLERSYSSLYFWSQGEAVKLPARRSGC
jgi:hypothetical protein